MISGIVIYYKRADSFFLCSQMGGEELELTK